VPDGKFATSGKSFLVRIVYSMFTVCSNKLAVFSECRWETYFKCKNDMCLPSTVKCDGYDHCGDGSDEAELCGAFLTLRFTFCVFPSIPI